MKVNLSLLRSWWGLRIPVCIRIDMYREHWKAYINGSVAKNEIARFGPPNLSYLGLPCMMACFNVFINASVFFLSPVLLASPWWRVVFYWGLLPETVSSQMLVLFAYFSLLGVLGGAYELIHSRRAVRFMRFLSPANEQVLRAEEVTKFKRFVRNTFRIIDFAMLSNFVIAVGSFFGSALMSGAWNLNRPWLIFWMTFWLAYFPSSYYVPIAVPGLLFIVVRYLRLRQSRLEMAIKSMTSARAHLVSFDSTSSSFERLVAKYITFNRELAKANHFWAFYLWLYVTILPSTIVYCLHTIPNTSEFFWVGLFALAASILAFQLGLIVHLCGSVRKGNRRMRRHLARIWRKNLEPHLLGNVRQKLRLQSMVQHVTLTDFAFRTINHQVIDTGTYISLLVKFAFVYIKLVSNRNFKLPKRQ